MQGSLIQETAATSAADRDGLSTVESPEPGAQSDELVLSDLLVEEISIDGMCGVY